MSDPEVKLRTLMALSQAGDRQAYRLLLEAARDRLAVYFTRRLSADPGSAEDLVQDTLMAVHEKRATYDPARPFGAWLHGIAHYKLVDHYRRRKIRETVPLEDHDMAGEDAGAATLARLDLDVLLARLPAKQAEAIRLTRLSGMTAREAAKRMDTTETSVKVSVHRGLRAAAASLFAKREGGS